MRLGYTYTSCQLEVMCINNTIPPSRANRGDLPLPRPACPDSWTLPVHGLRLAPVVPASFLPCQELERVHADSAHKQRPWGMA